MEPSLLPKYCQLTKALSSVEAVLFATESLEDESFNVVEVQVNTGEIMVHNMSGLPGKVDSDLNHFHFISMFLARRHKGAVSGVCNFDFDFNPD